ncbi:hypothetical protein KPH14_006093 [Odynerus spinipes]|uniref:Serine/threonine-protein kinase ATM n=1 Tax=Odynerus spinipes TaxID=1348599 RepID=A0AAD9RKB4_9HYME|nr:hypothetical protein KPH14_006093 [Odynerus spinipes]
MYISERITAILELADSKKVMNKKKCILELLELYENEEAIKEINKNSEYDDGTNVTWWKILTIVHKLILWEADRLATKDIHKTNSERQNTCAALLNTIRYSHESRTLTLKCNSLIKRVLEILHNRKYLFYCDTYLTILTTYILPVRLYRINILPEKLKELLSACINLYEESFMSVKKCTIVEAMQLIVQHGYVYSNLLLEIKQLLPFLEKILSDPKVLEQMEGSIYKLANTICYQVATENRIMLCRFGEDILPKIINLSSYDEKYKFMQLLIQIHHPRGVHQEDDAAFACNWDIWNEILRSMYEIILRDSKKGILLSKHFLNFASEVLNQVLQNPGTIKGKRYSSEFYSPPIKRRCITINSPVDMINHGDLEEAWPTIQILTILFAKYPKRVQPDDFIPLLTILTNYLTRSCKHVRFIDSIYEMCTVLMEIEQLFLNSSKKMDSTSMHWYNIWDILLRSLNTDRNEASAHKLAQCFIKYKKMRNTNSLFTLYISQTIRWSPNSLQTLIMCCEHTHLPDDILMFNTNLCSVLDTHSVKLRFIEWLLNTPWFKVPSVRLIESLCNILIGIPARFFHEKNKTSESSNSLFSTHENTYLQDFLCDDSELIPYKLIETCNLAVTFQINLFTKPITESHDSQEHLQELFAKANINIVDLKDVLAILTKYLYDIVDRKNENNDIRAVIMKIALAGKVAIMVKKMNILVTDAQIRSLMCTIENCLQHAYSLLEAIERSKNNHVYLIDLTNAFLTLYETFSHTYTDMTKIIFSLSTAEKLRNLFDLLNIEDSDNCAYHEIRKYNDNFDIFQNRNEYSNESQATYKRNDISSLNTIRIQTMRTLTTFCCMNTGKERYKIQVNLMQDLMTIDNYDFASAIDFKMAMIVLESFVQYDKEMLYDKYKDTPILFLVDLFKKCINDEKYLRCVLRIVPYFIKYAAIHNCDLIAIMDVFLDLCKLLRNNQFGPLVHVEVLKYLSKGIEIKPLLMKHRQYTHCEDKLWLMVENVLTYLQNPFYMLRLQALDCVQKLYSSNSVEYKQKVCFFEKLKKAAINLLSIEKELFHDDKADETETRTASILLIFATIICSSSTLQNSALVAILQLIDKKYIKLKAAQKVLHSIAKQTEHILLNEDNLACMLSYWLSNGHTMQTFPWVLTQCESQKEFYKTHINTLALIEIQNFNIMNAKQLCTSVEYRFKDVFEQIFAPVLSSLLSLICQRTRRNSEVERAINILQQLTLNQGSFETIDTFANLFEANLDKVIISTILKLHDEEHFYQMFQLQCQFPRTNSLVLDKTDVESCLQYIEEHFMSSESFLHYLATRGISKLQKILLSLVNNIYNMKFIEHKLKALHQYIYFCTIVIEGLKFDYFNAASMYLIREISYTLIHLIKNETDVLSEIACKYFHEFLKYILPKRCTEVKEHLNHYITSLVLVAQMEKTSTALNVLEYLIVEQKELLSDAIAKLNVFPKVLKFQKIWEVHNSLKYQDENIYNLEKEIRHFLDATDQNIVSCNLESLSYLKLQLSTRRDELQAMYNRLDSDSMGNYNLLHQFVCKLLEIVKSSDQTISIEATKCLGQLGPIDLGATILHHRKSYLKESVQVSDILTYDVVALLTEFLVDNNIRLRVASADALNLILSSVWGQKIVDKRNSKSVRLMSMNCSRSPLRINYISPFIQEKGNLYKKDIILDKVSCSKYINENNLIWTEESSIPYNEWIVKMTCDIIACFANYFLIDLIPVCKLSMAMCELILPRIIFLIMYINKELAITMCHCINRFFYHHFNVANQSSIHGSPHVSQHAVHCDRNTVCIMLDLVNFIRTQANENIPLELDFIYIAKAAQYCSAYFTAFLYAEMSCESLLIEPCDFSNIPKIDYVCEREPTLGRMLQNILRDACSKIGDPDAIRGCGSTYLRDSSSRVQHYIQMQEWDKVLLAEDIELSSGNKTAIGEMISALQQSGLHYLLGHCMSTMSICTKEMSDDIQLECAWRLGNWDIPVFRQMMHALYENNTKLQLSESDYYLYHFYALRCFHEKDELGVKNAIKCARMCITKALANISLECNKDIYGKLMQLQMLSEIEELCLTKPDDYSTVLRKWQQCSIGNLNEFQYTEPILTQRSIMYQINDTLYNNSIIKAELVNTYIEIAEIAQNQGHLQIAARALGTLAKQTELPSKFKDLLDYQESLLAWKRNAYEVGRYLMRNLIHRKSIDPILQSRVLRIYGNWMAETKSENPQTVIEKYYQESIKVSASIKNKTPDAIKNLHDTQVALARFADAQFEHVKMYMKSSQFECLKKCVEYSNSAVKFASTVQDTDVRIAVISSQKQNTNDAAELQNIEREKGNYLLIAVRYYLLTLCQSENYNLLVFRLIALWLENANNKEVNKLLEENLDKIPSFKFIPLIPQLAAHMNNVLDDFSVKVNKTLLRCALDHPHHTLPVLLALKNLYGDYEFLKTKKNRKLEEEPRILGARELLRQLDASKVAPNVREMEKLSHSLVMLANYEVDKCKCGSVCKIPASQTILKIRDLCNIFVPTLTVNVKCSGNYDNIIGIARYVGTFETVGGKNVPKKVVCIGTDGIQREQLLKGKDDLRQDAVMQQVFNVMNRLFETSKEAKRRKLKIRTYKVAPLTQRSGILEWCHDTIPIATILIGSDRKSGLHKKYNPHDYSATTCRDKMDEVSKKSNDVKLQRFLECCKYMRPAFHHFFIEKYPSPETWYEKRLAYTRSVATTSIAGYILGLGDRHLSNILMDQLTAEVIHIDFGIAFEQGKVLLIPETVPFRLTRDIEVAMGVSGVEGIMRRGCEEVLTVLRDQRQIIITLLQVLLYDPLFTWAITPEKAYTFQTGKAAVTSQDVEVHSKTNITAERALLRIEQKLQGIEEGLVFSVPGQVEQLIQQARDPSNLSRLYCGWQPYL